MWKSAVVAEPAFYYAPGWVQIANPEYTLNGSTYKVTLPIATTENGKRRCLLYLMWLQILLQPMIFSYTHFK